MNKFTLIEILKKGILEIRLLSSQANKCSCDRINILANILHNIPETLLNDTVLDIQRLKEELHKYEQEFEPINDGLSKILED